MKKQVLRIEVEDTRRAAGDPHRHRVQTYTDHKAFLRDLAKIMAPTNRAPEAGGYNVHEETVTRITIHPKPAARGLFDA